MAVLRNSILEDTLLRTTRVGSLHYQKKHNYGGDIQPCLVYWGTINLKDEYAPNKIVIKIIIFVEFGTVLLLSENIE